MWAKRRRRALLPIVLAVAASGAARPEQPVRPPGVGGTRLVIVTVERRVGAYFKRHPEEYGDSLSAWRRAVLALLFDPPAPLARPGDVLALFADGASLDLPGRTGLDGADGSAAVMHALTPMLSFPGAVDEAPPQAWVHQVSADGSREAVDEAIRARITCPLAGLPPACVDEGGGQASQETRAFSRPLLTLPLQYKAGTRAVQERGGQLPAEVYWLWVQVGERVNETNSLAAEIVRDFQPYAAAEAVARYHEAAARALEVRLASHGPRTIRRSGGVTVWELRSSELHALARSTTAFPVYFQVGNGGRWTNLEPRALWSTPFTQRPGRLLERGTLRLHLSPPAAHDRTQLVQAAGVARCEGGSDTAAVPLHFVVTPDGQSAQLEGRDRDRLEWLAARCLPRQGLATRVARELAGREGRVGLRIDAQALVGVPERPDGFAVPPLLATVALERGWRQSLLSTPARILWILGLLGAASVGAAALQYLRYRRSATQIGFVLLGPDGKPVSADRPLALHPGTPAGTLSWVALQPVCSGGPPRAGRVQLTVSGQGLQSDVPVAPGEAPGAVLRLRTRALDGRGKEGELVYDGPLRQALTSAPAAWLVPAVRAEALDLDRIPAEHPLRAGMEVTVEARSETPRVKGGTFTFYVPCTITVQRAAARPPELGIELVQRYLYRGLRPSDPLQEEIVVGTLRVLHRADPQTASRPQPVSLTLRVAARVQRQRGTHASGQARAGLRRGSGEQPQEEVYIERLDEARLELPLYLSAADVAQRADGGPAAVHLEVTGSWRELRPDGRGGSGRLCAPSAQIGWYPVAQLHGVALDFGTSATRMALLSEDAHADDVVNFEFPERIVDPGPDPRRALAKAEGRTGEIESEVVIDRAGNLVATGKRAYLEKRAADDRVLASLKSELTHSSADAPVWTAAKQLIGILGELVESPRRGEGPLHLCRWAEGEWRWQPLPLRAGFRYLLLVTMPDTFSAEDQARFTSLFESWQGQVNLVPLREAEAVVYGALRASERRPERTLVVDVGAGTVDYAAVRTVFDRSGLTQIRVEGLAVSAAAGDAFDQAVAAFLGRAGEDPRTAREIKQKRFCDPEVTGRNSDEITAFLASPQAADYFDQAIAQPLQALLGRLSAQESWRGHSCDQVILTGRGSLAAGWKHRLAAELTRAGLAPAADEPDWLRWPTTGSLARRADRLKGAVVEGALALVRYDQARIQTSRDVLRDHVLLLGHVSPGRFEAHALWLAGDSVSADGRTQPAPVGDWMEARLVLSSHLPGTGVRGGAGQEMRVSERLLWEQSLRSAAGDGWRGVEVRLASTVELGARPPGAPGIEVTVGQGGALRWRWTNPT